MFNIRLLLSFIRKFGFGKGLSLFLKVKGNKTENIQLPLVEYPFSLRPHTSDLKVFYQVFSDKEYELFIDFTPKTIIDAGANIGLASIWFANQYKEANIIAIEPDKDNYAQLLKNTKQYGRISGLCKGLWHKDALLNISDKFNGGKWAMVVEETDIKTENTLDSTSIDGIMKQHNLDSIDILKMDIESAEKEVFSDNYENWLPKTRLLVIELHDRMKPGCSKAVFSAIDKCLSDYTVKANGENLIIYNNSI